MKRAYFILAATTVTACGGPEEPACLPSEQALTIFGDTAVMLHTAGGWREVVSRVSGIVECVSETPVVSWSCRNRFLDYVLDVSEEPELHLPSCAYPGDLVAVTGSVDVPGSISIGGAGAAGYSSPWAYRLPVPKGQHDVLVTSAATSDSPARIVLQRDVEIRGDRTLPTISMANQGVDLPTYILTVSGEHVDDIVRAESVVQTSNGLDAVVSETLDRTIGGAPESILRESDRLLVQASASNGEYSRTVVREGDDYEQLTSNSYEFLARLSDATFEDGFSRAYLSTEALTERTAYIFGINSVSGMSRTIRVPRGWFELGPGELSFDVGFPWTEWSGLSVSSAFITVQEETSTTLRSTSRLAVQ